MNGDSGMGLRCRVEGHAFFLDVDGTLVDIAETPAAVSVDGQLLDLVRRLHVASAGALALVSGRSVAAVDRLFAPLRLPVAGQHGAERRDGAGVEHSHCPSATQLATLRRCVVALAETMPGVLIEDKGLSLAVHYRQAPHLEGAVQQALRRCLTRVGDAYRLQGGKMVHEVKPATRDKGTAIAEFMREAPFAGRVPIFVGDDVTDRDGFVVVDKLGGHSVQVGQGPLLARWRMADVRAVREWLRRLTATPAAEPRAAEDT